MLCRASFTNIVDFDLHTLNYMTHFQENKICSRLKVKVTLYRKGKSVIMIYTGPRQHHILFGRKYLHLQGSGDCFKNIQELLNLRALKCSSHINKIHILLCMDKIFCVEFQRIPLKFHTNILTIH